MGVWAWGVGCGVWERGRGIGRGCEWFLKKCFCHCFVVFCFCFLCCFLCCFLVFFVGLFFLFAKLQKVHKVPFPNFSRATFFFFFGEGFEFP